MTKKRIGLGLTATSNPERSWHIAPSNFSDPISLQSISSPFPNTSQAPVSSYFQGVEPRLTWFRNVPELLFVSLTKNLPPLSTHISAWARDTTLDLKASFLEPRALTAASSKPERSVKRPIRKEGSPSMLIASNLKER